MWKAPLVGMNFRPPAKRVLEGLAGQTPVLIERQPENPYDDAACRVLLCGFSADGEHQILFNQLLDEQSDPYERAKFVDPLQLGYIDSAKTGKARELSNLLDVKGETSISGFLSFDMSGKPQVEIALSDEELASAATSGNEKKASAIDSADTKAKSISDDDGIPF